MLEGQKTNMLFIYILCLFSAVQSFDINIQQEKDKCVSIYCRLYEFLKGLLTNLKRINKPVLLVNGLTILPEKQQASDWQRQKTTDINSVSLIDQFANYISTHDLQINIYDLFTQRFILESARKKDKGQGLLLAMSVMFAKMMALLSIGGIGLLALKALGVGSAALLLTSLMGVKTLARERTENTHSVQYVPTEAHLH